MINHDLIILNSEKLLFTTLISLQNDHEPGGRRPIDDKGNDSVELVTCRGR